MAFPSFRLGTKGSGTLTTGPSNNTFVHSALTQMRQVERRQWWLWVSAVAITLLLTLGILSFTFQFLIGSHDDGFYFFNLNNSARGLTALVLLFDFYCIFQQFQIQRIRRQLVEKEEQLRQAQKMEAIGRLSGGIAHDFNNLLSVIIGYADELEHQEGTDKQRRYAEQINKAGQRAASLTRQLLAFSRQQVLQPRILELNSTIADLGKMLRRLIGEHIEVILALDPALARVKVDESQMEQVIMNLVVNARDAMPEGGQLTITTKNTQLTKKRIAQMTYIQAGSYVELSVADTGTGMDPTTKAHIFEPFFTTKEKGKGTGLGLSTVYGVVKQSGGYIFVSSEVGQGTTFTIFLPQVTEAIHAVEPEPQSAQIVKAPITILLVEDEDSVRELISAWLTRHGYRVLSASNGSEALEIARNSKNSVQLLLTDVVLPGMNGVSLAKTLSAKLPELQVIYMTGYSEFQSYGHELPENRVLQKPFTKETLLREVGEVLSSFGLAVSH
jgi:two-component system, cell cycle sensor histidine kinase and response regulator CckA